MIFAFGGNVLIATSLYVVQRTCRVRLAGEPRPLVSEMLAFGRDGVPKRQEIECVADYVLSLSGRAFDPKLSVEDGQKLYAANCVACHGEQARGNPELGSPDLTDAIWLYGAKREQVIATITNGRKGVMPAWENRLDTTSTARNIAC